MASLPVHLDASQWHHLDTAGLSVNERGAFTLANGCFVRAQRCGLGGRVAFSKEDDEFLRRWVGAATQQGVSTTSPAIFQDLELVNSRHTAQSWHARWSKKLRRQIVQPSVLPPRIEDSVGPPKSTPSLPHTVRLDMGYSNPETRHQVLPPTRYMEDDSIPAPANFKDIQATDPPGRDTIAMRRGDNEVTLRMAIGLRDKQELATWLEQSWVATTYAEYASAVLDPKREVTIENLPRSETQNLNENHSSQKFLINRATQAIVNSEARYVRREISRIAWTTDDFDIRFMVQIVLEGRKPGRWWDTTLHSIESLCKVSYRLMLWIRHMHRFARSLHTAATWQKKVGLYWVSVLEDARTAQSTPTPEESVLSSPEVLPRRADPAATTCPDSGGSNIEQSTTPSLIEGDSSTKKTCGRSRYAVDVDRVHGLSFVGSHEALSSSDDDGAPEEESNSQANSSSVSTANIVEESGVTELALPSQRHLNFPAIPRYPVKSSKHKGNQIKALDWLSVFGKERFELQQVRLLADWGISTSHTATCVLVPRTWSSLTAIQVMNLFGDGTVPRENVDHMEERLQFQLADHATNWIRAATWFAEGSWPRRGIDLDLFLSCGPFQPMEGSHLCHHGFCVNPNHATYEDAAINSQRKRCWYLAQDLRSLNIPVPKHCAKHQPPCLLQLAALTSLETCLVQFEQLRRARSVSVSSSLPSRPAHHPFETFETHFPLSYAADCNGLIDLVNQGLTDMRLDLRSPTFRCSFCSQVKSFKSITGYWGHIRDKHGLVSRNVRLDEIQASAQVWRDHLEHQRQQGNSPRHNDQVVAILGQIEAPDFNWDVVMGWKLRYRSER